MLNANLAPIAADGFTRHRGPVTSVAAIPGRPAAVAVARCSISTPAPRNCSAITATSPTM
jgi:hypothetical protein